MMKTISYKSVFYLCVELISDLSKKDIEWDTIDKKKEYEVRWVREYYILDALEKYMAFCLCHEYKGYS